MLEEILAAWLPPVLLLFIGLLVRYESKIADKRGRPNRSRFVWYFVDKDLAKKHPDQMYTEDRKVNRHWTSEK